jgi:hypothetical protein
MPITALPTPAPSTSDPLTFDARADALFGALPTMITEANALETNVNAKEAAASLSATGAAASAVVSASSATVALAAANYKGEWTALSGAATVPYSVSHLGHFWQLSSNLANVAAKTPGTDAEWVEIEKDYSCPNNTEKIQYPLPTSAYMLKAGSDGEPVVGTNTDTDVADAVSKKHTQHTDTGTTATSFKINTGGSEADLQTTGLTADRDFTFPDIDTMLAGSVLLAQNTCEIIEYTP